MRPGTTGSLPPGASELRPVVSTLSATPPPKPCEVAIDFVAVLDHSKSMEGAKLEVMKQAAEALILRFSDSDSSGDRVGLVDFEGGANVRQTLTQVDAASSHRCLHSVRTMVAEGKTNTRAGIRAGLDMLCERESLATRPAPLAVLGLFTDFALDCELTEPKALLELCGELVDEAHVRLKLMNSKLLLCTFGIGANHNALQVQLRESHLSLPPELPKFVGSVLSCAHELHTL